MRNNPGGVHSVFKKSILVSLMQPKINTPALVDYDQIAQSGEFAEGYMKTADEIKTQNSPLLFYHFPPPTATR